MEVESYKVRYKYVNRFTRGLFFLAGDTLALLFSTVIAYLIISPFSSTMRPMPVEYTATIIYQSLRD